MYVESRNSWFLLWYAAQAVAVVHVAPGAHVIDMGHIDRAELVGPGINSCCCNGATLYSSGKTCTIETTYAHGKR